MNRVVLIGNGFDLAHGLPTSYREFIADYWENRIPELQRCSRNIETDGLSTFECKIERETWSRFLSLIGLQLRKGTSVNRNYQAVLDLIKADKEHFDITQTPFFEAINRTVESKKWVDIENIYYLFLKKIFKERGTSAYRCPEDLDAEFELIRKRLSDYLSKIQKERICEKLLMEEISRRIFEPFDIRDISCRDREPFEQALIARAENMGGCMASLHRNFDRNRMVSFYVEYQDINTYLHELGAEWETPAKERIVFPATIDRTKHISNIRKGFPNISNYFLWPDQILLLNFNYTKTADLYLSEESDFKTIHIHGELDNKENPMIFGYGDELDDDYKAISKLDDNAYLKNIKSIRYLETDNYRRLLTFIDSAPFQIYIMGHSCGNSDRTLLNTLFEHRNCVSIKPFYYKREDGTNDYIEIVQNISRNFNDMQMMRDRVVNKRYCHPLAQRPKP